MIRADTRDDLNILYHDAAQALTMREGLLEVYENAHAGEISRYRWASPDQFWKRLAVRLDQGTGPALVTGWLDGAMVGYACGSPSQDADRLWKYIEAAAPDLTPPVGVPPIFVFREFAVHTRHQGRGLGRILHDSLLTTRLEPMAELLVRADNDRARTAYLAWGWRKVRHHQPFDDPVSFHTMVLPLPLYVGDLTSAGSD